MTLMSCLSVSEPQTKYAHLLRSPGPGGIFNKNHQAKKHVVCVQHSRHHPQRQSVQMLAQEAEQSHGGHAHPELCFLLITSNLFSFFGRNMPVKYGDRKKPGSNDLVHSRAKAFARKESRGSWFKNFEEHFPAGIQRRQITDAEHFNQSRTV